MTHPYAIKDYADALSHWGQPLYVPAWETSVLIRDIEPEGQDAFGPYPLTIFPQQLDIRAGLEQLKAQGLVSVTLVLDDFHRPELSSLEKAFTVCHPYKTHFIHRPSSIPFVFDKDDRYSIRRAQQHLSLEVMDLKKHADKWIELYTCLVGRHHLHGLHVFPRAYHEKLCQMDGVTAFGAWDGDELVSAHLWVGDYGSYHSHLAASNEKGYKYCAAYGLNDLALKHFGNAQIINFGGTAGHKDSQTDGLAHFKKAFSNASARSYICGAVLDHERYEKLTKDRLSQQDSFFFPAYRALG